MYSPIRHLPALLVLLLFLPASLVTACRAEVPAGTLAPNDALVSLTDGRIIILDGTDAHLKGTFVDPAELNLPIPPSLDGSAWDHLGQSMSFAPDGTLFTSFVEPADQVGVCQFNRDGRLLHTYTGFGLGTTAVAWGPDGNFYVGLAQSGGALIMDGPRLLAGEVSYLGFWSVDIQTPIDIAWLEDGNLAMVAESYIIGGTPYRTLRSYGEQVPIGQMAVRNGELWFPAAASQDPAGIYRAKTDSHNGNELDWYPFVPLDGPGFAMLLPTPARSALAFDPRGNVWVNGFNTDTSQVGIFIYDPAGHFLRFVPTPDGLEATHIVFNRNATEPVVPGAPVTVSPSASSTIAFSGVESGGQTTVTALNTVAPSPELNANFQLAAADPGYLSYFDVKTTAALTPGAPIEFKIAYSAVQFPAVDPDTGAPWPNGRPRLLHDPDLDHDGQPDGLWGDDATGNWIAAHGDNFVDEDGNLIVNGIDMINHYVYGRTTSLSPFAVAASHDLTPPVITLRDGSGAAVPSGAVITAAATSTAGAAVSFSASATDDVDGSLAVQYSVAPGSTFALGATQVTVTARDSSGNSASATLNAAVTYSWSGVLQPVNVNGSSVFKLGSTVPVKFRLTGASAGITGCAAKLYVAKVSDSVVGSEIEAVSTAAATTGNFFRYTGGEYLFNWSTKGKTTGTYRLRIDLGDGVPHTVDVGLR